MVNRGLAPFDPASAVGQFRVLYGDVNYVPLDPAEPGYGNYTELSDLEIEGLLASAGGSTYRAIGNYYAALAGNAAKASSSIRDYDLQVDTTKRATDLLNLAKYWWGLADDEDTTAGGSDIFEVFSMVSEGSCCTPEAAPYSYCGCRGRNVLF